MNFIKVKEMQSLDRRAESDFGIPALLLMENAGRGIAELVKRRGKQGGVAIVCGKGNNGGDGFVAARHLVNQGFRVSVILAAEPDELKKDAALNFNIIRLMGIPILRYSTEKKAVVRTRLRKVSVIVDAVFGIGLKSAVREPCLSLIRLINESNRYTIAVDVPSGLEADTGKILGDAVYADETGTLGLMKSGLLKGQGPQTAGKITVIDISLPLTLTKKWKQTAR